MLKAGGGGGGLAEEWSEERASQRELHTVDDLVSWPCLGYQAEKLKEQLIVRVVGNGFTTQ